MIPVPLWVALLGLMGNTAVAAVMWDRGDGALTLIFTVSTIISFYASLSAGNRTAVRTADKDTAHAE